MFALLLRPVIAAVCLVMFLSLASSLCAQGTTAGGPAVTLARDGQPLFPVVIAAQASPETRAAAQELSDYLGRISGARFELRESQSAPAGGIVVAAWADFASLPLDPGFKEGILHEDDYLLRSHAGGLWVIGHTPQAVSHAVWGLLYHIGHRQFFPGDAWEVVPHEPVLTLAVDVLEHPDYRNRRVAAGLTSSGPDAYGDRAHVVAWRKRNRASAGPLVHSGHAYGAIIRRNRAAFDAHPEYLALVDGQRRGGKFCISNPGLQALIVEDALAQLRQKPDLMSIAMDPSDGGGWCECEPCAKFGSVTDRVVALTNLVAEAIPQGRYVGILAYNFHSPPPTIRIHPRVVVTVAAGHLTGGWTPERLFAPLGGARRCAFHGRLRVLQQHHQPVAASGSARVGPDLHPEDTSGLSQPRRTHGVRRRVLCQRLDRPGGLHGCTHHLGCRSGPADGRAVRRFPGPRLWPGP